MKLIDSLPFQDCVVTQLAVTPFSAVKHLPGATSLSGKFTQHFNELAKQVSDLSSPKCKNETQLLLRRQLRYRQSTQYIEVNHLKYAVMTSYAP